MKPLSRRGGRVDHFADFGDLVGRKAAQLGVFADDGLVLGQIDAERLVRRDEGLRPLDIRPQLLQHRIGLLGRFFARRFRRATGAPPLVYLQKLRIATARRLLESNGRTVQQVGSAVGYDDVAFFRDLFRRHTGVTPQAYRERFGRPS